MNMKPNSVLDEWFPRDEVEPKEEEKSSSKGYGQRGEQWTKAYMEKLCGIHLSKRNDAPVQTPSGPMHIYTGVDYYGSVYLKKFVLAAHVEVEVKTFEGSFSLAEIKEHQAKFLTSRTARGEIGILALAEREGMNIIRLFWIPWPKKGEKGWMTYVGYGGEVFRSFKWLCEKLSERADGRFQGKSIRPQDQDLLTEFLVEKVKGQWALSETHWLRRLLDIPVEQARLL
jgi:hypothetical protein